MSAKDHSGFYHAGAKALKFLAAGCGRARLARLLEAQAERLMLRAGARAQDIAEKNDVAEQDTAEPAPPPIRLVPAKRPRFTLPGAPEASSAARRNADVVDLSTARRRARR